MIWFAQTVLILWVPISAFVVSNYRPAIATAGLLLGATLFLPERVGFNPPLIPPLGKSEISQLSIIAALYLTRPGIFRKELFGSGTGLAMIGLLISAVLTAVTNPNPLHYGPLVLKPMTLYDGMSLAIRDTLFWGAPFLLGRCVFRTSRDLRDLMKVIVIAALIYSFFILFELRMSPHFHKWTYGFHQHSYRQVARSGGGYRPMVYMAHGLALAVFVLSAGLASAAVSKARMKLWGQPTQAVPAIMFVILIMCKSLGAVLQGLVTFPIAMFTSPRTRMRVAAAMGVVLIIYPVGRVLGVVPFRHMTNAAEHISVDRAESLDFRFENEELFLEKARQRIWFGWGGHRRARVFDPITGKDEAIPDSFWVIQIASRGLFGLACSLGLIVAPILIAYRRFSRIRNKGDRQLVSGLALMMGVYCFDMTVNGMFTNLPLFFSGALLGVSKNLSAQPRPRRSRSRFPAPRRSPVPA